MATLSFVATALAAVGDITPAGCFADPPDAASCGTTAEGLDSPEGVAVSPDGASVYAVSYADGAIVRFNRDANGTLTAQGCIEDPGENGACDDLGAAGEADGLFGPRSVAVSPDGASVYVVSSDDDAIVRFDRAASGALSNPSCIEDIETNGTCDDVGPAGEAQGLNGATDVAVSPDGASVYVASNVEDAIVRFDRAASGALSNPSCTEDPPLDVGCGATAQGLDSANAVAVSPDGVSVYAASAGDDAIVRFDRAAGGALSNSSCITDPPDTAGCGPLAEGLQTAVGVAVSPDGTSVYVVGVIDSAIVRFQRAAGGALSNPVCIEDVEFNGLCDDVGPAGEAQGLSGVAGVAVAPDGASVYTASRNDDAIVEFDRAASGALSNASCIEDPPSDKGCATTTQGLDDANAVAASPDGVSVYAVAGLDKALLRFNRTPLDTDGDGVPESIDACPTQPGPASNGGCPLPVSQPPADGGAAGGGDATPPDTQITAGPKKKERKGKASFSFSSTEPGSFECSLDGGQFEPCTSPEEIKVKKGKHEFEVRARDAAGNVDPTPAKQAWKVKKKR